jgi:hypothetical protein
MGKKNLAQHQDLLSDADKRLTRARAMLLELANEDASAFAMVNELSRLPEGDPRRDQLPLATLASAQIPLALAACSDRHSFNYGDPERVLQGRSINPVAALLGHIAHVQRQHQGHAEFEQLRRQVQAALDVGGARTV